MSSDRKLSTYEDRKIHKALKGIECNPAELEDAAAHIVRMRMQITPEKLKAYVENCAADEQKNARKSSTEVLRATELLERLETMNVDRNHSAYDVALVLKTIANAEELPEPKQLGQIDLRKIYSTLSLMAMGYPVEELDEHSKRFLGECYHDLCRLMPQTVRDLQQCVDDAAISASPSANASTAIQNASIAESLQSNELNPFALPLDFLVHKEDAP